MTGRCSSFRISSPQGLCTGAFERRFPPNHTFACQEHKFVWQTSCLKSSFFPVLTVCSSSRLKKKTTSAYFCICLSLNTHWLMKKKKEVTGGHYFIAQDVAGKPNCKSFQPFQKVARSASQRLMNDMGMKTNHCSFGWVGGHRLGAKPNTVLFRNNSNFFFKPCHYWAGGKWMCWEL